MFKNLLKRILPAAQDRPPNPDDTLLADKLIAEGNAHEDAGQLQHACDLYRKAVAVAPGHAGAHLNLGIALAALDDIDGAANAYQTVLRIAPHHAFGNYNFARLAYLRGNFSQAETLVSEALKTKPDFPQALVVLSNVQDVLGKTALATQTIEAALRLQPGYAGAWVNQATLLHKLGRSDDAEGAAIQALALEPGNVEALRLLSLLMRGHGLGRQALETLRTAIASNPGRHDMHSEELLLLNFDENIKAPELFHRHVAFGMRLEEAFPKRFKLPKVNPVISRRLRVGYVSGDLHTHPVALFMMPVLERHDRHAFEVFCYSSGTICDHITDQFRELCEHWTDASRMSDEQLADVIHSDAIDILVDLSGHTSLSRLAVFSQRPAPVQVSWLGYLNTSGLSRMDYRLCDLRTDPAALSQPLHTEKLFALPNSQWCYRPFIESDVCLTAPFETRGYITFGSFNSALKISPAMCRRWAQILLNVTDSRLLIANVSSERKRVAIRLEMEAMGISTGRIEFAARVDLEQYFGLFDEVDLSLDTFPYGGGTTTFDSLWMGVPVVTGVGSTPVSRSAASILSALDLNQWIAPTIEDYIRVATECASDRQSIARLRQSLRQLMQESPLMDEVRFVQDLEASYRAMWTASANGNTE